MKIREMGRKMSVLLAIVLPFFATVWALYTVSVNGPTAVGFFLFSAMYVLTILGVTVGWHRYFTHKGFSMSQPVACIFGILGAMAVEGTLFDWVSQHREHHRWTDKEGDPHSPVASEPTGLWQRLTSAVHAHCLWMVTLDGEKRNHRLLSDLSQDRVAVFVNKYTTFWVILGLIVPTVIGALLDGSRGAFDGFLWGGLVRIFFVHQITWSVNSICHLFGTQPFSCPDNSKNNVVIGFFACGEGFHNTHHAFEQSARHGLRWWEIDLSWYVIRTLQAVGLVWDVKLVSPERIKKNQDRKEETVR